LSDAWDRGDDLIILQFTLPRAGFAEKFRQLRVGLDSDTQVIAVFPGIKKTDEIGSAFNFIVVSADTSNLLGVIKKFEGRVLFQNHKLPADERPESPVKNNAQALAHGKYAAGRLGKQIKFSINKTYTALPHEIEKKVSLILLHLVRNAVDHGIEFPLERAVTGKPQVGAVNITAREENGKLVIEVCDDGRGISYKENIFEAGFSTAPFVTDISGRGIGLDTVLGAVNAAGGTINVESKPGHGCRFEASLPLGDRNAH
jgi:signal transduction histidine kinase